jgi:hypothetical protein
MTGTPSLWTDAFLEEKRAQADPLADEVVGQIIADKGPQEAYRLFDMLIRQIELPLEILPPLAADFLAQTDSLPQWAEAGKVRLAQDIFLDHGPKFLVFLYYKSLPMLYCCARGAEVLVRTGRLTRDDTSFRIFTRRIAETGQFLVDVMAPDGLAPGGKGIQAIRKVRLIHAAIRHFTRTGDWDEAHFGRPINQEDMAITLMSFSVALTDALEQFQVEESTERIEAYQHTWAAIGSLMGIDGDLLPASVADARFLMEKILTRQAAPSEAGATLADALVKFGQETLPSEKLDNAPSMLIQHLLGAERSRMLGVYAPVGCLSFALPAFLWAWFRGGERLEDRIQEPLQIFIDLLSQKMVGVMVGYFDRYKGRNFELPQAFQAAWLP